MKFCNCYQQVSKRIVVNFVNGEKQSTVVCNKCNNPVPVKEVKMTSIIFALLFLMFSLVVGMYSIMSFLKYGF